MDKPPSGILRPELERPSGERQRTLWLMGMAIAEAANKNPAEVPPPIKEEAEQNVKGDVTQNSDGTFSLWHNGKLYNYPADYPREPPPEPKPVGIIWTIAKWFGWAIVYVFCALCAVKFVIGNIAFVWSIWAVMKLIF